MSRWGLDPRPESVAAARRIVRETLESGGRPDLEHAGQLVVSELVTNALLHAGAPMSLTVCADAGGVLLEVSDGSAHLPVERNYATLAGTGRGLAMVQRLCHEWGARPTATGKTVWARIASDVLGGTGRGPRADADEARGAATVPREADPVPDPSAVRVRLLNVPLLLHLTWHQHAEALLREHLLARLNDDELHALHEHATASGAMALLHEQIPAPELPGGADRLEDVGLLTELVEPGLTLAAASLVLTEEDVESFGLLDDVIERAIGLAETDQLLTAPVQPELRELRRWLCGEVAGQSAGAHPRPWTPPTSGPGDRQPRPAAWDTSVVDRSQHALVAADDTDHVIAVSEPALRLLGYDEPAQLLGRRLLVLIPPRFHQAHLAGFTMHLTSGRRPLLDAEVTLPFVRSDGTEVWLRFTVEAVSTADDRRVFVAELKRRLRR